MDCSLPGSSVHGILQARILEWAAISFSRGSAWHRGCTLSPMSPALAGSLFTTSASWEPLLPPVALNEWLTGGGVKIPNSFALGWDNSEVCVLHLLPGFQSKTKPQWPIMITCMKMHQLIPVMLKLALLSLIGLTCIMWCFWTNHHPWSGWSDLGHTSTLRINFTRITKDWGWERERNQRPFPESIVIRCGTVKEELSSITDRGLRFTEKEKRFFFH